MFYAGDRRGQHVFEDEKSSCGKENDVFFEEGAAASGSDVAGCASQKLSSYFLLNDLLAFWQLYDASDGRLLNQGRTEHRTPGWTAGDYPDLVEKLDASLQVLSGDLETALRALVSQR